MSRLSCPLTIARRGQQVHIVISAGDLNQAKPIASLMKAVARSRDWAEMIISGKARTLDDLVKASGLTRAYVRRILPCAVLSPKLLDAILSGRHLIDLTVVKLTDHLPLDWSEQSLGTNIELP
jgi:site-specific DNA recombinase